MINKSVSLFSSFVLISNCALVDLVTAKTLPPSEIEPLPDLYALGSAYPVPNSVNYNASPNPQFSSNNFNHFNEQIPSTPIVGNYQNLDYLQQPTSSPIVGNYQHFEYSEKPTTNPMVGNHQIFDYSQKPTPNPMVGNQQNFDYSQKPTPNPMEGNYQNVDYSQKPPQPSDHMITGNYSPESKMYDFGSDLKNTLVSIKDNLGLMADTQRLLVNSLKAQQEHYNDIEKKLRFNDPSNHQNYGNTANQQPIRYQSIPPYPQPVQYQSIPPLPPLPYGQQIIPTQVHTPSAHHHRHHHKKQSHGKFLISKLIKKKPKLVRRLPLLGRDTGPSPLERRAEMALRFIKSGVANALWTALIVACVKLVPIILFGFKLMFQSVIPLTGLALFRNSQGLFNNHVRDTHDNDFAQEDAKVDVVDEVDSDDDDDDDKHDEEHSKDDISDSSEETD